jgi:protein-S-isoprenylcysteine O-methyltransferase Ste14
MKYPLDVVFLNADGETVRLTRNLRPNRITGFVPGAASVLEFPAGVLGDGEIRVGDVLAVTVDEKNRFTWKALGALLRWPVNITASALWAVLAYAYYIQWRGAGRGLILAIVIANAVTALLFLIRRESRNTSLSIPDWLVAFAVVGLSKILQPQSGSTSSLGLAALLVQAIGALLLIVSLLSLGRSLGLVPANRGIQTHGAYRVVRHPIYTAELILFVGILMESPSAKVAALVISIFLGQIYRVLVEERLLKRDPLYREYVSRTRHRFIPGII